MHPPPGPSGEGLGDGARVCIGHGVVHAVHEEHDAR